MDRIRKIVCWMFSRSGQFNSKSQKYANPKQEPMFRFHLLSNKRLLYMFSAWDSSPGDNPMLSEQILCRDIQILGSFSEYGGNPFSCTGACSHIKITSLSRSTRRSLLSSAHSSLIRLGSLIMSRRTGTLIRSDSVNSVKFSGCMGLSSMSCRSSGTEHVPISSDKRLSWVESLKSMKRWNLHV